MRSTTRNLCTFTALAGLSLGGIAAFAQDGAGPNTMDPTKMPPAKPGMTAGDMKDAAGSMASSMQADQAVVRQLMKIAQTPETAGDKLFVLETAMGNMWEIESSRATMEKSQDQAVKDLAKMMIQEHSMNNEKLMPIAQKMGIELPTSLPSEKQAKLAVMAAMPVADMEKGYLCGMKKDHAMTVTAFVDHAKLAKDEQLKAYIDESIPKLKEHSKHVVETATAKGLPGELTMDAGGPPLPPHHGPAGGPAGGPHPGPAGGPHPAPDAPHDMPKM